MNRFVDALHRQATPAPKAIGEIVTITGEGPLVSIGGGSPVLIPHPTTLQQGDLVEVDTSGAWSIRRVV